MNITRNNNPNDFTALPIDPSQTRSTNTYQPISIPASGGSGFGTGTAGGAATGAVVGSIVPGLGTAVGAAIGGGIGLLGDLANLWISSKAAKKQEGQTNELNAKASLQYEQETAEGKRRYDEQAAAAKKAAKWNQYKDRTSMLSGWTSNLFTLADKDQNVKNALVNLWRSAQ